MSYENGLEMIFRLVNVSRLKTSDSWQGLVAYEIFRYGSRGATNCDKINDIGSVFK